MNTAQLKIEVDHILDSGANDIRFIELIERLLKKESILFAQYCSKKNIYPNEYAYKTYKSNQLNK